MPLQKEALVTYVLLHQLGAGKVQYVTPVRAERNLLDRTWFLMKYRETGSINPTSGQSISSRYGKSLCTVVQIKEYSWSGDHDRQCNSFEINQTQKHVSTVKFLTSPLDHEYGS